MELLADGRVSPVEPLYALAPAQLAPEPSPYLPETRRNTPPLDEVARARSRKQMRARPAAPPVPRRADDDARILRLRHTLEIEGCRIELELRFDRLRRRYIDHRLLSTVCLPAVFPAADDDVRIREVLDAIDIDGQAFVLELRFDRLRRHLIGHRMLRTLP